MTPIRFLLCGLGLLYLMTGCMGGMGENVVSQAVKAEAGSTYATDTAPTLRAASFSVAPSGAASSRPAERAAKARAFFGGN